MLAKFTRGFGKVHTWILESSRVDFGKATGCVFISIYCYPLKLLSVSKTSLQCRQTSIVDSTPFTGFISFERDFKSNISST